MCASERGHSSSLHYSHNTLRLMLIILYLIVHVRVCLSDSDERHFLKIHRECSPLLVTSPSIYVSNYVGPLRSFIHAPLLVAIPRVLLSSLRHHYLGVEPFMQHENQIL